VFIRNCDGSSFTSSRPDVFTGADDGDDDDDNNGLYMQGKQILDGVLSDLLSTKYLGHASEVVITGCSAGGLAVMIHADSIADRIRASARDLRRPDAGDIKVALPNTPLTHTGWHVSFFRRIFDNARPCLLFLTPDSRACRFWVFPGRKLRRR
jgi:hypothetical protein